MGTPLEEPPLKMISPELLYESVYGDKQSNALGLASSPVVLVFIFIIFTKMGSHWTFLLCTLTLHHLILNLFQINID